MNLLKFLLDTSNEVMKIYCRFNYPMSLETYETIHDIDIGTRGINNLDLMMDFKVLSERRTLHGDVERIICNSNRDNDLDESIHREPLSHIRVELVIFKIINEKKIRYR